MKLVTYSESARKPARTGVIGADSGVIDIARAAKAARVALPFDADDMISLVSFMETEVEGVGMLRNIIAK